MSAPIRLANASAALTIASCPRAAGNHTITASVAINLIALATTGLELLGRLDVWNSIDEDASIVIGLRFLWCLKIIKHRIQKFQLTQPKSVEVRTYETAARFDGDAFPCVAYFQPGASAPGFQNLSVTWAATSCSPCGNDPFWCV